MDENLEQLVRQFQQASELRDNHTMSKVYEEIRRLCSGMVRIVAGTITDSRISIDEFEHEVFQNCLKQPPAAQNFRAYYRKALIHKLNDMYRTFKKSKNDLPIEEYQEKTDYVHPLDTPEVERNDALAIYRDRKRKVLDELAETIRPISQFSTLLLDQRQRVIDLQRSLKDLEASKPFSSAKNWIEHFEVWQRDDGLRLLAPGEQAVGEIWNRFSQRLEREKVADRDDMIEAIVEVGTRMNGTAWRKRVSRYLASVRDQVDDQEWLLFHATN